MADKQVIGEIVTIKRLNNSVNGNPRYRFSVLDPNGAYGIEQFTTSSDISDAYLVGNQGYRVGSLVTFTLTKAGRIARMETVR